MNEEVWRIFRREVSESTNLDARKGEAGDVFTAEFQTAGRGRLNHEWTSEKSLNLMFSAVLDVGESDPGEVATLPLVSGLALVRAFSLLLAEKRFWLKWPNDVFCCDRKLSGILCERDGRRVIVGVGINVNQDAFPPEIAGSATSLKLIAGRTWDREKVFSAVLDSLYFWYRRWRSEGFGAVHGEFRDIDYLAGRHLAIFQTDDDSSPITGQCRGIQRDGTLLVGTTSVSAGEAHVLMSP